jgi:protein TonB
MLRLRTTVGLSVLALAVGVGGTAWLSTLTDDWAGPPARTATHAGKVRAILRRYPRLVQAPRESSQAPVRAAVAPPASSVSVWPTLTPIEMPSLAVSPFRRAVPLHGRVILHLHLDGEGRVAEAAVAESSGDAALDERAMQTVRGWRFAVPSDHPQGLQGSLVMRFEDGADRTLSAP